MPIAEELEEELKREIQEEHEQLLEEVRSCSMTFGSLETIMARGAKRMARPTQEALAKSASKEADFPPSDMSALPGGKTLQPENKTEKRVKNIGRDPL